jgi:thiol-disulfide isomerase/thioredoxin
VPHRGLSLGEQAPDFTLAGLYGESVTLESLTSSDMPVLLLFTDPKCGPCNALMPQISAWQREHAEQLTIAVLTRGSVHDNRAKIREHGIANVWLDDGLSVHSAYQANGTPGAVLIDADGRIASPTVEGEKAISGLVAHATRPPEVPVLHVPARQAPPRRPAVPPVGARAPSLQLNDLAGARVALTDPERDTLVLFWNPRCGFCRQMLDDVRTVEKSSAPGAPRLLMISTGSVADNEAMRLQSPIALDAAFAAASAFGSSGTPSAILIDANGKVASGLAMGEAQVMALAMAPSERGA